MPLEFEELTLNKDKEFICISEKLQLIFMQKGKVLLLYPRCEEGFTEAEDTVALRVKFFAQDILSAQPNSFEIKYLLPFLRKNTENCRAFKCEGEIKLLIDKIHTEYLKKELGFESLIKADILSILVLLLRQLQSEGKLQGIEQNSNEVSRLMGRAMAFTGESFKTVTEKQVAEHCNISYSYFSRTFKRAMGISFTDYLNNLRITEAQRLLVFSKKTVTDIAMELGYSTASHFISQFKKRKGVSPKEYRTAVKGENYGI